MALCCMAPSWSAGRQLPWLAGEFMEESVAAYLLVGPFQGLKIISRVGPQGFNPKAQVDQSGAQVSRGFAANLAACVIRRASLHADWHKERFHIYKCQFCRIICVPNTIVTRTLMSLSWPAGLTVDVRWMQRGCQECVWDVYWHDMRAYEVAAAQVRSSPA